MDPALPVVRVYELSGRFAVHFERRKDLAQGAVVPAATLRLDRPGKDSVVLPVAGIIGCAA